MTILQQREIEREIERERERERQRDRDRSAQALVELEEKVQGLVCQGLIRMERTSSGHLDLHVVPVIPPVFIPAKTGELQATHMGLETMSEIKSFIAKR